MIWCDVNARVRAGRRSRSAVKRKFPKTATRCGQRSEVAAVVTLTHLAGSMNAQRGMLRRPVGLLPTVTQRATEGGDGTQRALFGASAVHTPSPSLVEMCTDVSLYKATNSGVRLVPHPAPSPCGFHLERPSCCVNVSCLNCVVQQIARSLGERPHGTVRPAPYRSSDQQLCVTRPTNACHFCKLL